MTITNENTENIFVGNGVTTVFPTNIYATDADAIFVYTRVDDLDTLLAESVDYTISGLDDPTGVVITATVAPSALQSLVVIRLTPKTQELDLTSTRAYNPEVLMDTLDRIVMMMQELAKQQARTFRVKPGITVPTELSDPDALADALDIIAAVLSGVGWQVASPKLDALVSAAWAADKLLYLTGANTADVANFTAYGRTLVGLANVAALLTQVATGLSIVAGDIIVGTGANTLARLGKGTGRQLLGMKPDASGLEYITGGRHLIASKPTVFSNAVSFTEFNNSIYRAYEFVFENVLPANDGEPVYALFSTNGGSSYDNAAGFYAYTAFGSNSVALTENSASATTIRITQATGPGSVGNEFGLSGKCTLYNAGNAAARTRLHFDLSYENTSGVMTKWDGVGVRLANQDTDAIFFGASLGFESGGSITMYGLT